MVAYIVNFNKNAGSSQVRNFYQDHKNKTLTERIYMLYKTRTAYEVCVDKSQSISNKTKVFKVNGFQFM